MHLADFSFLCNPTKPRCSAVKDLLALYHPCLLAEDGQLSELKVNSPSWWMTPDLLNTLCPDISFHPGGSCMIKRASLQRAENSAGGSDWFNEGLWSTPKKPLLDLPDQLLSWVIYKSHYVRISSFWIFILNMYYLINFHLEIYVALFRNFSYNAKL